MTTQIEQEGEKIDQELDTPDRGALLVPPRPPEAGTIVLLLPPTASWTTRRRDQMTELQIRMEGQG